MASVLLFPDNEGEDKHVESKLIPRFGREFESLHLHGMKKRPYGLSVKAFSFIVKPIYKEVAVRMDQPFDGVIYQPI